MGLQSRLRVDGGYWLQSGTINALNRFAQNSFIRGALSFGDGTGSGQANSVYYESFSVNATTMRLIDLKGGNGELDVAGAAMAMTAVKLLALELTTPGASTSLRFGPQNQTDAAQLWFPGVGATAYTTELDFFVKWDARAGWSLGASTKVLAIYNPGASAVAAKVLVIGTK